MTQFKANPLTKILSLVLFPLAFNTLIDLIGYMNPPFPSEYLTLFAASTAILAKKSESLRTNRNKLEMQLKKSHNFIIINVFKIPDRGIIN